MAENEDGFTGTTEVKSVLRGALGLAVDGGGAGALAGDEGAGEVDGGGAGAVEDGAVEGEPEAGDPESAVARGFPSQVALMRFSVPSG